MQSKTWHNRRLAKQLISFDDLQAGRIHPTDVDGVLEYQDKCYVWLEYKYRDAQVPTGQRIFLERVCNDLNKSGKPAIAIIAEHSVKNPDEDIQAGHARVREVYWRGKWHNRKTQGDTVAQIVTKFIGWTGGKNGQFCN